MLSFSGPAKVGLLGSRADIIVLTGTACGFVLQTGNLALVGLGF